MSDRDHLEKLLAARKRYLNVLEEQQAEMGQFCPPHVITGIQDTQAEIAQLEAQLGYAAPPESQSNLPRLPFFFGREKELALIADSLAPDSRGWGMLIDGPGGIGKTALAIQAAHQAPAEHFPHKIFLSAKTRELRASGEQPLTDFTAPDFMALLTELGRELGDDSLGKSIPDQRPGLVRNMLARQRALLLIDNLETLPEDERTRLFQFLDRLPQSCKALVTSRRRTDINARTLRLDRLEPDAALAMLAELAHSNPLLAQASQAERAQLYETSQGNPLLMRWIVGQLGRPGSHCRTITQACRFLEQAPPDNDPLEYIFGDLISGLSANEHAILAALVHFNSPALLSWIAILTELAQGAVDYALQDLRDRAMVIADAEGQSFMLPALAASFIRRRLPKLVQASARRLTDHVTVLVKEHGHQKYERFQVLDDSWPLINAALASLLEGDNAQLQLTCDALLFFLDFSGRWDEQLQLSEAAEARAIQSGDYSSAGWRSYTAGRVYDLRDQADAVLLAAGRAAQHWQQANAGKREQALAIQLRGAGHQLQRDYTAAIQACRQALDLLRSLNIEDADVARGFNALADVERLSADHTAAERDYREALRIARKINDHSGIAGYMVNLALLALDRQDWPSAETLAREALGYAEAIGRQELIAYNNTCIARALARQNKAQEGLAYARKAIEIYTRLSSPKLAWAQEIVRECGG